MAIDLFPSLSRQSGEKPVWFRKFGLHAGPKWPSRGPQRGDTPWLLGSTQEGGINMGKHPLTHRGDAKSTMPSPWGGMHLATKTLPSQGPLVGRDQYDYMDLAFSRSPQQGAIQFGNIVIAFYVVGKEQYGYITPNPLAGTNQCAHITADFSGPQSGER